MRIKIIIVIFASMFLALVAVLFKIQVLNYDKHRAFIDSLQQHTKIITGLRGTIYDRNGEKLAWSKYIPYLYYRENFSFDEIKKVLGQEKFRNLVTSGKVALEPQEVFELEKLGYEISYQEERYYSGIAFHVVGYTSIDVKGLSGIEKIYEEKLKGKYGTELILTTPSGKIRQRILKVPPENGESITLTIDAKLQRYIEKNLEIVNNPGAVIVENVKTGEILAMASYPSIKEYPTNMDLYEWKKIIYDSRYPLLNRAVAGLYSPGSAIKPLIAITYLLEESTPATLNCTGTFNYVGSSGKVLGTYKDWLLSGHGETDLIKAIRVSCNVYFYNTALKLGINKIESVAKIFNIAGKTGIEINEKQGIFPDPAWKMKKYNQPWYPGDTIITGIGQGYILLTPLELLNFYVSIANNGIMPRPHLIKGSKPDYKTINLPQRIWKTIKEGLIEVTSVGGPLSERGTAYESFKDFPIPIAGKTGTAEVGGGKPPHSWFVGFAPVDNPEYAVIVLFENGGSGSEKAAPFARKIFDYLLLQK
ncbi:peptidoglycan glycosyltransferase [Thermosipho ferrireducens]|uniref:Peptidoglycan glycosyltransferase n=1 Tax=Thermosipho ferrireducens TaxID=2571116 RepID=A0ABX7S6K6_9BACT|nr:penicillin-binding transpeptidase domain-containing protein [Thermosipho ferrireducens]QTA38218.1 peptidoglycan glycosyltransferase [Thermosipho ferrireducens]